MGLFSREPEQRSLQEPRLPDTYMPPDASSSMHPMMFPQDQASRELAEYVLQNADLITKLRNKLRGVEMVFKTNENTGELDKEFKPVSTRVMNEDGVSDVVSFVESHLHRNTIMTKIDDKNEAMRAMQEIHISLAKHLVKKHLDYSFKLEDLDLLVEEITNIIMFCVGRGMNRGEAQLLYKGRREIFTHSSDDYARHMLDKQNTGFLRGI